MYETDCLLDIESIIVESAMLSASIKIEIHETRCTWMLTNQKNV